VYTSTVLRRAFDKAVRRKPPVVAADAGLMQIPLREGVEVRRSRGPYLRFSETNLTRILENQARWSHSYFGGCVNFSRAA